MAVPKKYAHIDFGVTEEMKEAAERALRIREDKPKSQKGMTRVGLARARQILRGGDLTPDTWRRMLSYFERHELDKQGETWDEQGKGWQAWNGWGGDPAFARARRVVEQMTAADDKPTNNAESDVRRLKMFTWGEVLHENGNFEVDQEFFENLQEYMLDMSAQGFSPPVMKEHTADGFTYGRVRAPLYQTAEGIEGDVEFAKGMSQLFDDGYLDSWSPSFFTDFVDPTSGKTYPRALRELSFVSVRHLKNLPGASPHYALAENELISFTEIDMTTENNESSPVTANADGDGEEKSMMDRMDAMESKMSSLGDAVSKLMEMMEDGDDEEGADMMEDGDEEPEATANAEVKALAQEVAELKEQLLRKDIRVRVGTELAEAMENDLVKLHKAGAHALFESQITQLAETSKKPTVNGERGVTGAPAPTSSKKSTNLNELVHKAKSMNIPRGAQLLTFLSEQGVDVSKDYDVKTIASIYQS